MVIFVPQRMKRFLLILTAFLGILSCGKDQVFPIIHTGDQEEGNTGPVKDDPDDVNWAAAIGYVFDASVIPEIHLSVTKEQWNALLAAYDKNHNTQEFIVCDVEYRRGSEVTKIGEAGLRLKGNTSRRRPYEGGKYRHVHFGLNLHRNHEDPEHTIKGVRRVDLKWFKDDPAYVREIYCYDLFRRFGVWTAVNDVYARLWLKVGDEKEIYYGVYEMLEHIDKNYLRARLDQFGSKSGDLWKCFWPASLAEENASMGLDDNHSSYTYELKTGKEEDFPAAKARLKDFIHNVKTLDGVAFNTWIGAHMDVDLFLKTYAVNVAVGMWDDYWNNTNNYYLYIGPGDDYKVWFIPYDYDNTLGTTASCGVQSDAGRQDPYKWGSDKNPLMTKILKNSAWKAKYKQYLQQLCQDGGLFSYKQSVSRIRAWQNSVKPYVSNDTGEDMAISDRPASWSNHGEYRLLEDSQNNFFKVKAGVVGKMQ